MTITKTKERICATCGSWFGGSRVFERGMVKYDASPRNTGICIHPMSGKKNQKTKPQYTCSKWTQAFADK